MYCLGGSYKAWEKLFLIKDTHVLEKKKKVCWLLVNVFFFSFLFSTITSENLVHIIDGTKKNCVLSIFFFFCTAKKIQVIDYKSECFLMGRRNKIILISEARASLQVCQGHKGGIINPKKNCLSLLYVPDIYSFKHRHLHCQVSLFWGTKYSFWMQLEVTFCRTSWSRF